MKHAWVPAASAVLFLAAFGPRARAQGCVGCTPLSDLGAGTYLGQVGGLYAGGSNVPPPAHAAAAAHEAARVVPRDASGAPHPLGTIGLVSFTMSNANQEFSAFERRADLDPGRNARVRVVNLAEGGQALDRIDDPGEPYWAHVAERVAAAGLTPEQVQVAWLKMADAQPTTAFPQHAMDTASHARTVLQILRGTFPNLRIAYFSSRIYGGNTTNPLRGEPLSYETGFAVKFLIADQIAGDPGLNWDPAAGPVVAPLVLWGPYLWANGTVPRSDGLVWLPGDFEGDGVHPAPSGEQKVADMLEAFFAADPTAPWYAAVPGLSLLALDATADAFVDPGQPAGNFGALPQLRVQGPGRDAYAKFDTAGVAGAVQAAKLSLIAPASGQAGPGTQCVGVSDASWTELGITASNAPPLDGTVFGTLPGLSRGTATSYDVISDVQGAAGAVSFGLRSAPGQTAMKQFLSREGGGAPRLVLTVCAACAEPATYCTAKVNSCGGTPALSFAGVSSATFPSGFEVRGAGANEAKSGLLLYTDAGRNAAPFSGGTLCVATPLRRSPATVSTGGSPGACDSTLSLDLNALAAGALGGNPPAYLSAPGQQVNVQWWARDTFAHGSYLSDGGEYVVGP